MARFPTAAGAFRVISFAGAPDGREHLALVRGEVAGAREVAVRLHSECLTGDALGSLRCDCRDQLRGALELLGRRERGVLLYLRQEGRGIGLNNKIRAYALQDRGLDTVEANRALGFPDDLRDYAVAGAMLRALGVASVLLVTNNPDKVRALRDAGLEVAGRLPTRGGATPHNRGYLRAKTERLGHLAGEESDGDA